MNTAVKGFSCVPDLNTYIGCVLGLNTMDVYRGCNRLRTLGCVQIHQFEHWCSFIEHTHFLQVSSSIKLKTNSIKFCTANICLGCSVISPILFENYNQPQCTKCVQHKSCTASTITSTFIHERIT